MVIFKFLGTLKQHVPNGEITLNGNYTLAEALAAITNKYESLKRVLYVDGTTQLHDYYRILVNGEVVELLDGGLDTRLKVEDVVSVFPPIAGG